MQEIKNKVIKIIEELSLMEIDDTSKTLVGDLSIDSLRLVMLLVSIEDSFDIELDQGDMNPFALSTVDDVISLVEKYAKRKEA